MAHLTPVSALQVLPRLSTIGKFIHVHRSLATSTRSPTIRPQPSMTKPAFARAAASRFPSTAAHRTNAGQPQLEEPTTTGRVVPLVEEPTTDPQRLSYFVGRSKTRNLPIYLVKKGGGQGGGTKLQTVIKKVEGDKHALVRDLSSHLGLEQEATKLMQKQKKFRTKMQGQPELIWINQVNGHVVVRGHRKLKVEQFLRKHSF